MFVHLRPALLAGCCGSVLAAAPTHADPPARFSIEAHVIAASSAERSASPCYRLATTMAEPVAGTSASMDFALSGGFLAHAAARPGDDIFFNGFEECTP